MTTDSAVLLDIEGTTTAISFVSDVLFPYAAQAIPEFLAKRGDDAAVRAAADAILADATAEERALARHAAVIAVVKRQMAGDVKATGLKALQGLVWQYGYEAGTIKGHVYADVPTCFAAWKQARRPVAIYSSGSVLAQRLIFGYSTAGDLTANIVGYYDTTSGPKREAASYTAIAKAWGRAPASITFGTDQPAEADAARAAGMHAMIIMRPGNAPLPANLAHPVHADLLRI